jgi:hypothetical protein
MSNPADRVEIITSVQRRRRWTAAEKVRMVETRKDAEAAFDTFAAIYGSTTRRSNA